MFNIVWQSFATERKMRKMVNGYIGSIYYSCIIVQSVNHFLIFVTPWTAARQAALSFTISTSLL